MVDTAQGLGLRFNTLEPWSPPLPDQLAPGEPLCAKFTGVPDRSCDMYQGTVTETSATAAEAQSPIPPRGGALHPSRFR